MDVRLLGLIELCDGGHTLPLPSARARALLASLAWQPRVVVTDAVLMERIWGVALPHKPQDSLYTCAKRLRRALEETDSAHRLVRLRGGYLLDVGPVDVDVYRFRSHVARARDAVRREYLYEANDGFDRALRGWTGTPLADLEGTWSQQGREALGRERLLVQLASAEVKMRLGRHSEVVPLLSELASEHPLDEAVTGLLMIALHRCGLRGAAMSVYAGARRHLARELGVEPGQALRRVHQEMLGRGSESGSGSQIGSEGDREQETASVRLFLAG